MNSFLVFFKKEMLELVRTKKLYILIGIFALFGMVGPVTARYMNDIIKMAVGDQMPIIVPATTWADGWAQFYSNLSQMGGIGVIFLFMSSVAGEKQSGSAALTLTKNLTHTSFIIAKFIVAAITFIISFVLAVGLCYGYTYWLFGNAGQVFDVLTGGLCYTVFTLTLLALVILASTIAHSTTISAIISFAGFIILSISSYAPGIGKYMPGALLSKTTELSSGASFSGIGGAFAVSSCLTVVCIVSSVHSLKRQEI